MKKTNGKVQPSGTKTFWEVRCSRNFWMNVEAENPQQASAIASKFCEDFVSGREAPAKVTGRPAYIVCPYDDAVYTAEGPRKVTDADYPKGGDDTDCPDDWDEYAESITNIQA